MKMILFIVLLVDALCLHNIMDYGAVPNSDTITDQFKNQQALFKAIYAANSSS